MDQSVIILIIVVLIVFLLLHFVFNKCPKCKKSGGMVQVDKKEIKRDEIIDLEGNYPKMVGYKVTYEITERCKYCGYTQIHKSVKKIKI